MPSREIPAAIPSFTLCPLCGKANLCAMEIERTTGEKQGPCWCTQATFSRELLARIPQGDKGTACICAACVAADAATRFGANRPD
jgi:hypothetical protein